MQAIYKGLPEFFKLIIDVVEHRKHRDSLSIVAFHLLADILKGSEHALVHYFTLTLSEPFLQNSHIGTPYQKWADQTNQNFQRIDQHIKLLFPTFQHLAHDTENHVTNDSAIGDSKRATIWYSRLLNGYGCCVVNLDKPSMQLAAINFDGWIEPGSDPVAFKSNFGASPAVITSEICLSDRAVLKDIQHIGLSRVEELRSMLAHFATWLKANYTMNDISQVPQKDPFFYKHWIENGGSF